MRNRPGSAVTLLMLGACLAPAPACAGSPASSTDGSEAAVESSATVPAALPGAPSFGDALRDRLARALAAAGTAYEPRSEHLDADGAPQYTNRLILETSPYLRQHAHNPVDWYPWGDEAFATARRLGRPVLLSVGYSTCHWCHVMERESFEDVEIARYLNEHYVSIKVDREERPDIDSIYMTAVQLLTGRGGWPMTVWLTPDQEPFYGGTYFPARDGDRGTRHGFLTVLREFAERWESDPEEAQAQSARLAARVRRALEPPAGDALPDARVLVAAAEHYRAIYDPQHGGVDRAPKFPSDLPLRFLLREHRRSGDGRLLEMAVRTLDAMADGGLHDQIGGGFHRYSTDAQWRVPHFEKMLYDQALLAVAYLEGYRASGRERFADVTRITLDYVAREMTAPGGGFYSATDADSLAPDGSYEEGRFFTWTAAELAAALDADEARAVTLRYGVSDEGELDGRNVLHVAQPLESVAAALQLPPEAVQRRLDSAHEKLYRTRLERPAPLRDDKILSAWNGLMISAFARAGGELSEPRYLESARRAAAFVLDALRVEGRLMRVWNAGSARHTAYLDDHAFMIAGLLDLYEATWELRWLDAALELQARLDADYRDPAAAGGYFFTAADHESLLTREKPVHDGAEPSGNSVELLNLLRLHALTSRASFAEEANAMLRTFGPALRRSPASSREMLLALGFEFAAVPEIVIVVPQSVEQARGFLDALRSRFVPDRIVVVASEGADLAAQSTRVPLLLQRSARDGRATAYVCYEGICRLPATEVEPFLLQIEQGPPAAEPPG